MHVNIEPITQSMLILYKPDEISKEDVLRYVSVVFSQRPFCIKNSLMTHVQPNVRKGLFRSFIAGGLLLLAYFQRKSFTQPTVLVYSAVIATGYAVLTHGTSNKLRHPDILIGILSLGSLGPGNVLHGAMVTWAVNVLELLHDMREDQRGIPVTI